MVVAHSEDATSRRESASADSSKDHPTQRTSKSAPDSFDRVLKCSVLESATGDAGIDVDRLATIAAARTVRSVRVAPTSTRSRAVRRLRRAERVSTVLSVCDPRGLVDGDPVKVINDEVAAHGHDLAAVGGARRAETPWMKRLLRGCECSVLIQRCRALRTVGVLAALDVRESDTTRNRWILDTAVGIARRGGGDLHVVHAWEPYDDLVPGRVFTFTPPKTRSEVVSDTVAARQRSLDELLVPHDRFSRCGRVHLEQGPPTEVIERVVRRHRVDVVVMGASLRPGVLGRFRRLAVEDVVESVDCCVLGLRTGSDGDDVDRRTQRCCLDC